MNCVYNKFLHRAPFGLYNLLSDSQLQVMLLRSTGNYVPDPDHPFLSTILANGGVEISVTSYARQTITGRSAAVDNTNDMGWMDCDNISFGTLESGQTVSGYVIFENITTDADSVPYYHCDGKINVISAAPAVAATTGSITGITKASPGVVTSAAHGLSPGDKVYITDVEGMVEVNSLAFTVGTVGNDTFQLQGVNTTGYTTYTTGGTWTKCVDVYVDPIEEDIPHYTPITFENNATGFTNGLTSAFARKISVIGLDADITEGLVAENVQTVLNLPAALGGGEFSIAINVGGLIQFRPWTRVQ